MTMNLYERSLKKRLAVLFSPLRLALFIFSGAWCLALNLVNPDEASAWRGPVSVIPIIAFTVWTVMTDVRQRRPPREDES